MSGCGQRCSCFIYIDQVLNTVTLMCFCGIITCPGYNSVDLPYYLLVIIILSPAGFSFIIIVSVANTLANFSILFTYEHFGFADIINCCGFLFLIVLTTANQNWSGTYFIIAKASTNISMSDGAGALLIFMARLVNNI